jgi:hypothetical protein
MIRRSTWIFLGLFVAVLAFAWGFQRYQAQRKANTTPTAAVDSQAILDLQESSVANLRVENDQGQAIVLGRDTEGLWTVLEPQGGGKTDTGRAESAMTQLLSLRSQFALEMPDNLQEYGLLNPAYTITLTLNGGEKHILQVGMEAPAVSGYYIRLDNGPPLVVSKFSLDPVLEMIENPPYAATETPLILPDESGTPGAIPGTGTPGSTTVPDATTTPQP